MPNTDEKDGGRMWEYRAFYINAAYLNSELNQLGKDGWECCGVFQDAAGLKIIVKRERKDA